MVMNMEPSRTSPIALHPMPNMPLPPMPFRQRQAKRKNSEAIDTLIKLKRSFIDSSAGFPTTRWSNIVHITSKKTKLDTTDTATSSPEQRSTPETTTPEKQSDHDFHGDLRLDPLLTFVTNSIEQTTAKLNTQLATGPLGEVFGPSLIGELITHAQYELTLLYLFVHERELFERNEGLCDNATSILIDQMKQCAITKTLLSDILPLIVAMKAPKSWQSDEDRTTLSRLQASLQRRLQCSMSSVCSNRLSQYVNLQVRLLPQLTELASRWHTASLIGRSPCSSVTS